MFDHAGSWTRFELEGQNAAKDQLQIQQSFSAATAPAEAEAEAVAEAEAAEDT